MRLTTISFLLVILLSWLFGELFSQQKIPLDTTHWDIKAKAYVLEHYKGQDAIYIQQGGAVLKDAPFLNGTIEFDVFLTERQSFPGVYFRGVEGGNEECFFLRPHLSGKPDANQAAPAVNGLVPWQLYHGPTYSFPYTYNFDDWTHIKLVVDGDRAQVFLDHAEKPHLSWHLKHPPRAGEVSIGGSFAPMHYANFTIDPSKTEMVDFEVPGAVLEKNIVLKWSVSDKFEEKKLSDLKNLKALIAQRSWKDTILIEENSAANISWVASRYGTEGNTVFVKLLVHSDRKQVKRFEFGYSDRVVAILNGEAIYGGNNKWRTRDYRYLGTIGLFDSIFLPLEKGENTLLLAVSEDFGGWGVMGRFVDNSGIRVEP